MFPIQLIMVDWWLEDFFVIFVLLISLLSQVRGRITANRCMSTHVDISLFEIDFKPLGHIFNNGNPQDKCPEQSDCFSILVLGD